MQLWINNTTLVVDISLVQLHRKNWRTETPSSGQPLNSEFLKNHSTTQLYYFQLNKKQTLQATTSLNMLSQALERKQGKYHNKFTNTQIIQSPW